MNIAAGHTIAGRYHIVEQLGEGGMAIVYKAYDTRLERDVAIKLIRADEFGPAALKRLGKRFDREAKSLAKFLHANIVPIIDYGEHNGIPYLVMAYLPGGTLKEQIGKPCPTMDAAALLAPVARALAYAHARDIVHRDVKPANILITAEGVPMLSDFGIARVLEEDGRTQLTGTGVGVGTPEYMSPEQCMGQPADGRADIYALGVVFYELLTGRTPFKSDTPMGVVLRHLNDPLPRPSEIVPDLPEAAERVLFKALAKDPDERYQDMGAFAKALDGLVAGSGHLSTGVGAERQAERVTDSGDRTDNKAVLAEAQKAPPVVSTPDVPIRDVPKPGTMPTETKPKPPAGATYEALAADDARRWSGVTSSDVPPSQPLPSGKGRGWFPGCVWVVGAGCAALLLAIAGVNVMIVAFATRTLTHTATPTPTTRISDIDGMVMVYVPEGDFEMGSNDGDGTEQPIHTVYLDAFWIDRTEVTNAMYADCVATGSCTEPYSRESYTYNSYYGNSQFDDYPVINVDWNQAQAYCEWAGKRLPSEAEWEKAARGTDGRTYPWGDAIDCSMANYSGKDGRCVGDTTTAGSYPQGASSYGALDMAGNVWEWVADWYSNEYYGNSPSKNPNGPSSGGNRILRGGSWHIGDNSARSANRDAESPDSVGNSIGFRCAASP